MKILAIDTSCDETSAAVCENDRVLSNIISSQIDLHKKWRGVVPIIAKRAHQKNIDPVISLALKRARVKMKDIDIFAVSLFKLFELSFPHKKLLNIAPII